MMRRTLEAVDEVLRVRKKYRQELEDALLHLEEERKWAALNMSEFKENLDILEGLAMHLSPSDRSRFDHVIKFLKSQIDGNTIYSLKKPGSVG